MVSMFNYNELWTLHVRDNLQCIPDSGNRDDPFAVAVKHGIDTVGHVPQKVSCICSLFLRHGGSTSCTVMGDKRRSTDLPQGDLEIPCLIKFEGPQLQEFVDKVRIRFMEIEGKKLLAVK